MPGTTTINRSMNRVIRWVAIGLMIMMSVIALTGCLGNKLPGKDNDSPVIKVASESELHEYLYQKIPGLKRAENMGYVSYPAQTFDIPEQDGDVRLEKVWYSSELVYVVYSLGNLVPDETYATLRWVDKMTYPGPFGSASILGSLA